MFGKLYIFDATTSEDRDQAGARIRQNPNMTVLGVTSKENWIMARSDARSTGQT
jgi:hypothetical protein